MQCNKIVANELRDNFPGSKEESTSVATFELKEEFLLPTLRLIEK